ncbi:MAG: acyloxyacyl hydrolase [Nitrospirae bacterium]|nr:acyloxyacyl hydrolase [Nitrospirota bacterium]
MENVKYFRFLAVLFIAVILVAAETSAQEAQGFQNAKNHWTFLGGYGITHPGLGDTRTRVETVDFILQYGYFLSDEKGKSWYRSRHELLIEVPFYRVMHPETAIITGLNFLACWNFTASKKIIPYISAGGGPVYTNLNAPELGSQFHGNYQARAGFHYLISKNMAVDFHYRFHHISNANTADPNSPLNSSKMLFGISYLQ